MSAGPGAEESPLKKHWHQHWPLDVAAASLLSIMAVILTMSVGQNQGHLVYALDDPYIHMAMARNFARYHVWGATRYGFTSSSSSPLWSLILSLSYFVAGDRNAAPLLWNLLFSLLGLLAANAILCWYKIAPAARLMALLGMILLIPLPAVIMAGMEPPLQILISLLTVFIAARWLSGEAPELARRDAVWLLVLAPLVTAVRFDGLALIAAIALVLLFRRRWRYAAAFVAAGALPVIVYGIISVSEGWFWFPNSVLLKATVPNLTSAGGMVFSLASSLFEHAQMAMHVPALLIAVLLAYLAAGGKGIAPCESRQLMGSMVLLVGLAHLEFVRPTLLYRYSAYLAALCVVVLAAQLPVLVPRPPRLLALSTWTVPRNVAAAALVAALAFPLVMERGVLLWQIPQCTTNIFEQQYQMGLFVRQYYSGAGVALNDIGAVNYLADIHCFDLWGLASLPVARARREHQYQAPEIARFARQAQVKIAIIYDAWFAGALPPDWVRVGTWTIRNNLVAGSDTVSFYAVQPAEVPHLVQCLRGFYFQLPKDVMQRGPYLSWGQ